MELMPDTQGDAIKGDKPARWPVYLPCSVLSIEFLSALPVFQSHTQTLFTFPSEAWILAVSSFMALVLEALMG
jgi:hypothetical protein